MQRPRGNQVAVDWSVGMMAFRAGNVGGQLTRYIASATDDITHAVLPTT